MDRLHARGDSVVDDVIETIRLEIPTFAELPEASLQTLKEAAADNLVGLIDCIRENRRPRADEMITRVTALDFIIEQGVPLADMLHGARLGATLVWNAFREELDGSSGSIQALSGDWAARLFEYLDLISTRLTQSQSARGLEGGSRGLPRQLAQVLISDPDPVLARRIAAEAGIVLSQEVVVAAFASGVELEEHWTDELAGFGATVKGRAVFFFDLPGSEAAVNVLARKASKPIAFASPQPWEGGLGRVFVEVCETADLAARVGMTGAVSTDELITERLLAANPAAARRLYNKTLGRVAASDRNGVLMQTIHAYLDSGTTNAAADLLHVHPHTISYRLAKVRQITGVALEDPEARFQFQLALRAARLLGLEQPDRASG